MGHRIGTQTRGRQTIHTLHDDESGASAAVLPSYGFNVPIVSGAALISSTAARSSCRSTTARMRFMVLPSMRPGKFIEHRADSGSAFLVGRYQISRCSLKMLSNWPTDAVLPVRGAVRTDGPTLDDDCHHVDPTAAELPYGFGIHPYYPGNQDPHRSLQPIRSSNSRSRLPRDQRSTTESTEMHGKENPNQLPLSVSFRSTNARFLRACANSWVRTQHEQ